MKGQEAIDRLQASVVDLVVAVEAGAAAAGAPGGGEGAPRWDGRDVLAHALWWHERYLAVLSAKVDDRPRPRLPGRLDDINEVGIEAYRSRSEAQLAAALRAKEHALESLVGVLYERPDADRVRLVTRDESAAISLDRFVGRVTSHLHGHARELRRPSRPKRSRQG